MLRKLHITNLLAPKTKTKLEYLFESRPFQHGYLKILTVGGLDQKWISNEVCMAYIQNLMHCFRRVVKDDEDLYKSGTLIYITSCITN